MYNFDKLVEYRQQLDNENVSYERKCRNLDIVNSYLISNHSIEGFLATCHDRGKNFKDLNIVIVVIQDFLNRKIGE